MTSRRKPRAVFWIWILVVCAALVAPAQRAFADKVDDLSKQLRSDPDYKVRLSAALNLGKLGDKRAIPALTDALSDSDKTVRGVAAAALGKLVDGTVDAPTRDKAIKELKRVADSDADNFVRSQAAKSYDALKGLSGGGSGGGTGGGGGGVYVEVGPMADSTKNGASIMPLMHDTVQKTIQKRAPSYATTWPGGKSPSRSDLDKSGTTAFYVDGTLVGLEVKRSGSGADISCNVSLLIATFPEKSMFAFLKGGASVTTGSDPKSIDGGKQDCVSAVIENLTETKVIPTIKAKTP